VSSQQEIARRELAALDQALGRSAVREAAELDWPGWLPPMHTRAQYAEHQRRMALWEAQRRAGLQESAAMLTGGHVQLQEANAVAPVVTSSGRLRVTLISPGWGSSGYYSSAVLEAAAKDKVWATGTLCFVDHPTQRELNDRPERSVRDLAAVLTTDARWTGKALEADAQLLPQWKATFADPAMARAIGMSIRGDGEMQMGEAEGRQGRLITKLVHGQSVDFVTTAGRGGSYRVIESRGSWWAA
jgi:hypothetical protein